MNRFFTVAAVSTSLLVLSGCSISNKVDTIRQDADSGRFEGMSEQTKFSWSIPNAHKGPYSDIDTMHVSLAGGLYGEAYRHATFVLGKSRETDEWEVFSVMIQNDDQAWEPVRVKD